MARIGRAILFILAVAAVTYLIDYAIVRVRVWRGDKSAFASLTVRPYYAVPRKDHKVEFIFDDPQNETCVQSLYPHFGDRPCWYAFRHTEKRTDM